MPVRKTTHVRLKGNYFANPDFFCTDVTKGVTRSPTGTRFCTLPTEFLLGLRDAVLYECGRSYRTVLKTAGKRWGSQFIRRFERELTTYYQAPFRDLPAGVIRTCLADAFNYHGYGRLRLQPHPDATDVHEAELHHSIFPAIVGESDRPVDLLIAGMLGAVLSHLTGKQLDCVQTECPSLGAEASRFVIGPAAQIAEIETWIDQTEPLPTHEAVLQRLLARQPADIHACANELSTALSA